MSTERLSTLDEYGSRRFVVPAEVKGRFRVWRHRVYFFLLAVFLGLPWIYINGLQAILLDIPRRRFVIFGQLFMAHDAPLLFFLFAIAAMALAFATAVWGRIWCGWACPQTVFIDAVYRRIEIWVEGGYIERRRLRAAAMSPAKFGKLVLKWALFLIVSSLIAHSFIAYFTGSRELVQMILNGTPNDNFTYFLLISAVTAVLLFNFGWFREQFCSIMCPYGRFQSVLMDNQSLNILYDEKRGACVSCNRCVEVCPAAIDIRDGVQMECIGCTACIDACNEIMAKVHQPPNLIRYANVSGEKLRIWRPRTLVYFLIACVCSIGLATQFVRHEPFVVSVFRAKDIPYQVLPNGMILNHLKAHFLNQSQTEQTFEVSVPPEQLAAGVSLTQANMTHTVKSGEDAEAHFFLTFPKDLLSHDGEAHLNLTIHEHLNERVNSQTVTVVGPR